MDIIIALFLLACVFVFSPGPWTYLASYFVTAYFLLKALSLIGGRI